MAAAKHATAGASAMYQTRSMESSCNQFMALFNMNDATRRPAKFYTFGGTNPGVEEDTAVPGKENTDPVEDEHFEHENIQNVGIEEMSDDEDKVEIETIENQQEYSEYTQAAMEGLRMDLARMETNQSAYVTSSGDWIWDLEPSRPQAVLRHPNPPQQTYRPPSFFSTRERPSRIPSMREREINALR